MKWIWDWNLLFLLFFAIILYPSLRAKRGNPKTGTCLDCFVPRSDDKCKKRKLNIRP